jgi:hypothetical protein
VICRQVFTPVKRARGRWSETCGSMSCRSRLSVRRSDFGARIAKAVAAKKAKARERIAAITMARFGELTDRERAIFTFAADEGYTRGYNARMGEQRKAARTEAA